VRKITPALNATLYKNHECVADLTGNADSLFGSEVLFTDQVTDGIKKLTRASPEQVYLRQEIAPNQSGKLDAQAMRQ
jgi:hypothetical protein